MGIYQTFSAGPESGGGIMNKPQQNPVPVWLFYFNVDRPSTPPPNASPTMAARSSWVRWRCRPANGSSSATDPQGAYFALIAPVR